MSKPLLTPRAREMQRVLQELEESCESVRSFADRRGITESTIWYWRRRLRERDVERDGNVTFAPVRISPSERSSDFEVTLAGGHRVSVPAGFDEAELSRLIEVLESC